MSEIVEDVIFLLEGIFVGGIKDFVWDCSVKGGNMILNQSSINEDSAFETSGVFYLKEHRAHGDDQEK